MRRAVAAALVLSALGCAHHGDVDIATLSSNSDQVIWEAGDKALKKKEWEGARKHFKRIIDGFPQSRYGPAARLALADSHYDEGGTANYILAVSGYRDFLTLYPSHPKSPYAQFRVGEAFFKQRNSPDRDQAPTQKALDEYERGLELYPDSPYAETTRARVVACRQSLARSEFLAGYFYQRSRRSCRAALLRYQGIVTDYPDFDGLDQVLYHEAECLGETGRAAEALPQLQKLLESFPQSPIVPLARTLQERLAAPGTAPRTPVPAAPGAPAGPAVPTAPPSAAPAESPAPTGPALTTPASPLPVSPSPRP